MSSPRGEARGFRLTVAGWIVAIVGLRCVFAPWREPLSDEMFVYVVKAVELTRGNFAPLPHHGPGWPLVLAPVMLLMSGASMLDRLEAARFWGMVVGALGAVPLALLARRLAGARSVPVVLALFATSRVIQDFSILGYTEPLYMTLFLGVAWYASRVGEDPRWGLAAAALAAFSGWVRWNGLAAIPLVAVAALLAPGQSWRTRLRWTAAGLAVAAGIAAPYLAQRWLHFGAPFFLLEETKVQFAGSAAVLLRSDPAAGGGVESLRAMVSAVGPAVKFVARGYWQTARVILTEMSLPVLLGFVVYGLLRVGLAAPWRPVLILGAGWVLGHGALASIPLATGPKYLLPALPLLLLVAGAALCEVAGRLARPRLLAWAVVAAVALTSYGEPLSSPDFWRWSAGARRAGLVWGEWIARNVRGAVAIDEGEELVMVHLGDVTVSGMRDGAPPAFMRPYAPRTGLRLVPGPGEGGDGLSRLGWLRQDGTTHLAASPLHKNLWSLVTAPGVERYLVKIYESPDWSTAPWPMRVYRIDWDAFDRAHGKP